MNGPSEGQLSRTTRRFAAGSIVFRDGEAASEAFLLQHGRVRLFKQLGAVERSLRVVRPGELFGESALIAGSVRGATALALDDVTTLAFGTSAFRELIASDPDIGSGVAEQVIRRLGEAEDQIEILLLGDVQAKIVVALLKLGQQRAHAEERPDGQIGLLISPLELSARVGLDVDSVKRIVLSLREAGYVRIVDEKVEIPDLEALRELYGLLGIQDQLRGGRSRDAGRTRAR